MHVCVFNMNVLFLEGEEEPGEKPGFFFPLAFYDVRVPHMPHIAHIT